MFGKVGAFLIVEMSITILSDLVVHFDFGVIDKIVLIRDDWNVKVEDSEVLQDNTVRNGYDRMVLDLGEGHKVVTDSYVNI